MLAGFHMSDLKANFGSDDDMNTSQLFLSLLCAPQNTLLSNLLWLCSIVCQSVRQKNWFTVFNVKVTARAYKQNMTISVVFSKLLVDLQPSLV